MNRVGISGIGLVSPFGLGMDLFETGLYSGECAMSPITRFDASPYRCQIGGEVKGNVTNSKDSMAKQFLAFAMEEAAEGAGLSRGKLENHRMGLILPVVTGPGNNALEHDAAEWIMDPELNLPSSLFHRSHIIRPTSACASIGTALSIGYSMIRHGQLDIIVIARAEVFNQYDFASLDIVRAITKTEAKPFDVKRNGITIGEGAGVLILESAASFAKRQQQPLAWLDGASCATGGEKQNMIELDKGKVVHSIQTALQMAGIDKPDYIHAHATGTPQGDTIESEALVETIQAGSSIPVSSHKGACGHLLRCSGFLGTAAALLTLKLQCIPPTTGLDELDPKITANIVKEKEWASVSSVLVNNFGFCGNYASFIIQQPTTEWKGGSSI
ncbi:beta-ketoacyl-[acyl-carrier-protein] synthase family protein [Bacillus changyiensis]|uniref:beta-ketoacyl-[acyl-carrier-protein] synthase family protein n=1 Tax=Bacillus changyiensis TaxID=3004103 RepID=UPI0022E4D3C2|nr:beta-ketoacyl synthase N-terminal-like domain-containing protein [Bacillus changyiensis]MDA1477742.1 beta-ketoacyl synthase N-terminal-like domain-containing protein [Bacillus changyiensis]